MALLLSATGLMLFNLATADPIMYLPNIVIKSDGTVAPETEFIKQDGNVYTLTSDLVRNYAIKIQCSNIVFDGAGHNINGTTKDYIGYSNAGLRIENVTNVTVKNVQLIGFSAEGITLENCVNCTILRVDAQPFMLWNSNFNTIVESSIVSEYLPLLIRYSNSNTITRNNITIVDIVGKSNVLFENNVGHTTSYGVNTFWDNGSIGNYWSDYATKYLNASEVGNSGIGDTPYVIDANNIDHYPLMAPVDNTAPAIEVLSPAHGTYNASSIQLSFTVDEPASPIAYSLDGKENITITGNITLTGLANGVHDLTIYAKDKAGNVGTSETICFFVDVPFPTTIVATASGVAITGVAVCLLYYYKKRNH